MKKNKIPNIVAVAILTLITIISWIAFGVIRTLTVKDQTEVSSDILSPLNPTYDQTLVDKIEKRLYFERVPAASPTASPNMEL